MFKKQRFFEKKSFFFFIFVFLLHNLLSRNDFQNQYSQPIIHIHNTVVTSGSSLFSAFKYFSLMAVAWEGGARFSGYSRYGFINKVLKPVFNWFLRQTKGSVEQCIHYFRSQNTITATLFVDYVLEPLKKRFFQDVVPSTIVPRHDIQEENFRSKTVSTVAYSRIDEQRPINSLPMDKSANVDDRHVQKDDNRLASLDLNPEVVVMNIDQNLNAGENNPYKNNAHQFQDILLPPPIPFFNIRNVQSRYELKPDVLDTHKDEPVVNQTNLDSPHGSGVVLLAEIFALSNNKKEAKEKLESLVDNFLKNEYQKGNDTKRSLIESFYLKDQWKTKFKKFSSLKPALQKHLRTSFFIFATSLIQLPLQPMNRQGFAFNTKNDLDQAGHILKIMNNLYCEFEKNPRSCLEMIGFEKKLDLKKMACL